MRKVKSNIRSSEEKKIPLTKTLKISSDSESQEERWDLRVLGQDAENPDILESLQQLGKKIIQKAPPLKWILTESPTTLTAFVTYCLTNPKDAKSEASYEFWKFMREPGTEIILTEAAYRGYLPAMSILASHYENLERSEAADYWQKVGVAHLNPTSIMLRGLNIMIQGKHSNNESLVEQGNKLIILSHMLGEDKANKIMGFEALSIKKPFDSYNKEEILTAIYEIENINEENILPFLTEIREGISGDHVSVSHCIDVLKKINDILDNPGVTICEIAILLPLRKTIIDMLNVELANNFEFLEAVGKAELLWKYQRIGAGSNFVNEIIIPMIYQNKNHPPIKNI